MFAISDILINILNRKSGERETFSALLDFSYKIDLCTNRYGDFDETKHCPKR